MRWLVLALLLGCVSAARAEAPPEGVKTAIEKGLRRIETGAASYTKNRACFSCHHQAMSMLSLTAARQRGFRVEPEEIQRQTDFTLKTFAEKKDTIAKGQGVAGGNTQAAYALYALDAVRHPADETTAVLVQYLLGRQRADGAWPALTSRPPTEGSAFTNTALALRGLRVYGPAPEAKDAGELRERLERAFARGKEWLLQNKPANLEDRVWHLRGLVYAGAGQEQVEAARAALLKEQKEDGSWAQLPDLGGDAYATGNALMALRLAGLPADDPAYGKGVRYLLATQQEDGAWIVETRSRPVQVFFDNGDPGGKSQFISFVATNWAVLALLELYPVK
jgi:N-acyl-D-amino-acid deacylase